MLGLPRPGPEHTLPAPPNTQTEVRPLSDADAVVVGAGHNGLVAANLLVDAGWDVVVLEAEADPGGAVRSAELTLPGFTHDGFSAFYPHGAPGANAARAALAAERLPRRLLSATRVG